MTPCAVNHRGPGIPDSLSGSNAYYYDWENTNYGFHTGFFDWQQAIWVHANGEFDYA